MSVDFAVEIIRRAAVTTLVVAGPLLITSLLVGVTVSLVQAVTQIQEQTLTFIPKILTLGAVLMMILPWMLTRLVEYMVGMVSTMGSMKF